MSTNSIVKTIIIVFTGGILILSLLAACFLFIGTINMYSGKEPEGIKKIYYIERVEKYVRINHHGPGGGVDIYFSRTLEPLMRDSSDVSMTHMPYYQLEEWDPQVFILCKSDTIVLINPSSTYTYKQADLFFLMADNIDLIDKYYPIELGDYTRHPRDGDMALTVLPDHSGIKIFDEDNYSKIPLPL